MRQLITAAVVALMVTPLLEAQGSRVRVDVSRLGPQVGERVPDFSLRDQNGRVRNLQSVVGARGAMVVFIRSADW